MPVASVVGAGPNGLAAGIRLAQAGWKVYIFERAAAPGGGVRTEALTLPGFRHDVCSAIHPMAAASPFFQSLELDRYGLEWVQPTLPVAHALDRSSVALHRSVEETAAGLGPDERVYAKVMGLLMRTWKQVTDDFLGPLPLPPRHPMALLPFALLAPLPASVLLRGLRSDSLKALFSGLAAHSILSLRQVGTTAYGLMMAMSGHAAGWPFPKGGAANLTRALVAAFEALGGRLVLNFPVTTLDELPKSDAYLLDVSPNVVLRIAGSRMPGVYRQRLTQFRRGGGVFKIDYALKGPIPWMAEACHQTATVHLGGPAEEIVASEDAMARGRLSPNPFLILAQHTLFDTTRAPSGYHTAWVYCHTPNGCNDDRLIPIENQIERFAPGFSRLILARKVMAPVDMEAYNPNYAGGDINGGAGDIRQLFSRPVSFFRPYATAAKGVYICSASTPPGGGVHGMSGYHAAELVLHDAWSGRLKL
ncbi:MAG TPA: NAD(P)/FAD-dependent oxidoreductase [Candidatus Xenobia bacterium]|jgi:phytoene dehydrogenase-like protein